MKKQSLWAYFVLTTLLCFVILFQNCGQIHVVGVTSPSLVNTHDITGSKLLTSISPAPEFIFKVTDFLNIQFTDVTSPDHGNSSTTCYNKVNLNIGDINGDKLDDFISHTACMVNSNGQTVSAKLRIHSGSDLQELAVVTLPATYNTPLAFQIMDLNGDKTPEVMAATGNNSGGRFSIYSGRDLTFIKEFTFSSAPFFVFKEIVKDIDQDGIPDFLFARLTNITYDFVVISGKATSLASPLRTSASLGNERPILGPFHLQASKQGSLMYATATQVKMLASDLSSIVDLQALPSSNGSFAYPFHSTEESLAYFRPVFNSNENVTISLPYARTGAQTLETYDFTISNQQSTLTQNHPSSLNVRVKTLNLNATCGVTQPLSQVLEDRDAVLVNCYTVTNGSYNPAGGYVIDPMNLEVLTEFRPNELMSNGTLFLRKTH